MEKGRIITRYINSSKYNSADNIYYFSNTNLVRKEEINDAVDMIYYTYDSSGRVKTCSDYLNELICASYDYDTLGRLIETRDDLANKTYKYSYDDSGNILTKVVTNSSNSTLAYNRYVYDSVHKDQLVSVDDLINGTSKTIVYNTIGYPTSINNNSLTWEGRNLKTYGTNAYYYNDEGIRYKKVTSNGTYKYELEGNNIVRMTKDNSLKFDFMYDSNNQLVSILYNGKEYFYVRNILGDILGIVDNIGEFVAKYKYDAFGNTLDVIAGSSVDTYANVIRTNNPFRYKGYYYDEETQLFYCNSRYYSPELCRWISPDSIEYLDPSSINGLNLYAYCGNNPVMYYDPTGHSLIGVMLLTGLIMGLSMVTFQGVSDLATYAQTGNWDHVVWQDYVGNFVGGFIGGALSVVLTSGLAASLAATGVSRLVSMNLQNATGDANYSTWDIAKDVGLSMLVTTVTYGLTYGIGNKLSGNNYFKTYSDLPYLLGHGLTKGVEKGVVNQFMYQYAVMTMNMGLIASFGDYVVGYKWKNKLLGAY